MTRYNTLEQQKLIDDTREEILQRMRDRIKREEKEEKSNVKSKGK